MLISTRGLEMNTFMYLGIIKRYKQKNLPINLLNDKYSTTARKPLLEVCRMWDCQVNQFNYHTDNAAIRVQYDSPLLPLVVEYPPVTNEKRSLSLAALLH